MSQTRLAAIAVFAAGLVWPASVPAQTSPQHPSLLFTATAIPLLKERVQRAPYDSWWSTIQGRANAVPTNFSSERDKARWAKSLAFAYTLTDSQAYAVQAAAILADVKFPPRGGDLGEPHIEGEAVAHYAVAYDMLHPYLATNDPTTLEQIRTILAEEADRLYDGISIKIGSGIFSLSFDLHETPHIDNWHLRVYGGLGLAALALADHPGNSGSTPDQWADRALDTVQRTLDFQIEPENGGYAEGPFYSRYAADVYLPYALALRRLGGGDLLANDKLAKMHDWSLAIRLPSGRRPNIDDAHLDDFYGHYLAGSEPDGGVHRWDWETNTSGLYTREYSEMDAIALYDDSVPAQQPDFGPTVFMPGAGDAVFRSDWSDTATYMLLRGEHGTARNRGLSHEHPDETAFIIHAGGQMLALDAGYINFDNHNKVNHGANHNLVLVDGQGPPLDTLFGEVINGGNDAYIENFYTSSFADYAEVRARYQGVDVKRRVLFAGKRYFVLADELRDQTEHTYQWRLHGNGGGTSGGEYSRQDNLARWTREGAELLAYIPMTEGRTFSEVDTLHSFDFRQELTHTALRVEQTDTNVNFLSVLYPRIGDEATPVFSTIEMEGGQAIAIESAEGKDWVWMRNSQSFSSLIINNDDVRISSNATLGFMRVDNGGNITALNMQEVTSFNLRSLSPVISALYHNTIAFDADVAVNLSLTINGDSLEGYVSGPEAGYSLSFRKADPIIAFNRVADVLFQGIVIEPNESGSLTLVGEGSLSFKIIVATVASGDIPGDIDDSNTVDFDDFFLFADNFGQDNFDPVADLDGDGNVDFDDFFLFADNFGKSGNPE
jgi:hypothetical protein